MKGLQSNSSGGLLLAGGNSCPEGICTLLSHLSLDGGDGHDTHDVVSRAAA